MNVVFEHNRADAWWSGDNPYIRLYDNTGTLDSVVSYFDVSYSSLGAGRALFFVSGLATAAQQAPTLAFLSESLEMGEFLRNQLLVEFTGFRDVDGVGEHPIQLAQFCTTTANPNAYSVRAVGEVEVSATWSRPMESFYYQTQHGRLPAEFSSLFVPCEDGSIDVDGARLPGLTGPDTVEGRSVTSACLALAEVWFLSI